MSHSGSAGGSDGNNLMRGCRVAPSGVVPPPLEDVISSPIISMPVSVASSSVSGVGNSGVLGQFSVLNMQDFDQSRDHVAPGFGNINVSVSHDLRNFLLLPLLPLTLRLYCFPFLILVLSLSLLLFLILLLLHFLFLFLLLLLFLPSLLLLLFLFSLPSVLSFFFSSSAVSSSFRPFCCSFLFTCSSSFVFRSFSSFDSCSSSSWFFGFAPLSAGSTLFRSFCFGSFCFLCVLRSPLSGSLRGSLLSLLCRLLPFLLLLQTLGILRTFRQGCWVSPQNIRRWVVGLWPPGVRIFALTLLLTVLTSMLIFVLTLPPVLLASWLPLLRSLLLPL